MRKYTYLVKYYGIGSNKGGSFMEFVKRDYPIDSVERYDAIFGEIARESGLVNLEDFSIALVDIQTAD